MKKLFFLLIIFYSLSLGQGWNSIVTTSIHEPNLDKMDLFTNKDGNHLLIKRTDGSIIYYKLNSSGSVQITSTLASNSDFPNITGTKDKVFALYKSGSNISGKYSTNGGSDWQTITKISITSSNECNNVDAVYQDGIGVHIVYATKDNDPYYETYYWLLNTSNQWVNYKNVTDYGSEIGGFPSVSFSTNKVHVSYNTGTEIDPYQNNGIAKTRDKNGSNWETPQQVTSVSSREKLQVNNSNLFDIYLEGWSDLGSFGYHLKTKSRTVNGTTWGNEQTIDDADPLTYVGLENTSDSKLHLIYKTWQGLQYRYHSGSSWSSATTISNNYDDNRLGFSTVSNDLYLAWFNTVYTNNNLRYRQYDAAPLAPQNLTFSLNPGDSHIRLQWDANTEPDISLYEISRKVNEGSWSVVTTTTNTYWVDPNWAYNGSAFDVSYRLRVKDINNHYSVYSNTVICHPYPMSKESPNLASSNTPKEFLIQQNFPNPFNPTTKIQYTVPQDSRVQLKVYNILGSEVAELVNEFKSAGIYEADFDASKFSSGVYIYRITAISNDRVLFNSSKQMILMK